MNKSSIICAMAALAVLSSCSNNDEPAVVNGNGTLKVNASINQVKSRAAGTQWSNGDLIGVSGGEFVNVPYVTDGSKFSAQGEGIFLNGNDEISFSAYYPYAATIDATTKTIAFDVADNAGNYTTSSESIDFMFAPGVNASVANPEVNFMFSHSMAKMVFTVNDATNTLEDGTEATLKLENIATAGTFDVTDGSVTPGNVSTLTTTIKLGEAASLIVPSYAEGNVPETMKLSIDIEKDGKTAHYSVALASALNAGTQYNYTLSLNYGKDMDVTGQDITDWTQDDNSGELVSGDVKIANIGDYLMKDGSVIKASALTDENKTNVAGVVYFVGNPQPSVIYPTQVTAAQDQLRANYSKCFNGLAIALNNANETATRFGTADCNYLTIIDPFPANFSSLTMNVNTDQGSEYIIGFNNTAYVNYVNSNTDNTTATATVSLIAEYNTANPVANASTWYIPSMGEFKRIQANYETIKTSVENAGGELPAYADFATTVTGNFYWTSDFRGGRNSYISTLSSETGTQNLYQQRTSNGTVGWFRLAIAF